MITGVYLDSVQLDVAGVYCQKVSAPHPDVAFSSAVRGGFSGRKMSTPRYVSQRITTEWFIIANGYSDLATKRDAFIGAIGSVVANEGAVLGFAKSNGISVEIDVKSSKVAGDIAPENVGWCKLLVEFETEYPFFTSQTEYTVDVNIFQGGGWEIPFGIPFDMSAGGSNAEIINQLGNTDAYPVLRLVGPLINPSVMNYTMNKSLSMNYTLNTPSDIIEIDTYNRTVFYIAGGGTPLNLRQYISGDFLTLKSGNNDIRLGSAVYNASGLLQVVYKDHYLNV